MTDYCRGSYERPEHSVGDRMRGEMRCPHCGKWLKVRRSRCQITGDIGVMLPRHKEATKR